MSLNAQNQLRRLAAYVATAFGILTQAVPALHLPVAVSAVLTACAPVVEIIEHWANVTGAATTPPAGPPATGSTNLVTPS